MLWQRNKRMKCVLVLIARLTWMVVAGVRHVDLWQQTGEELLAGPHWLRLEDGRHGQSAVPCLEVHEDVVGEVARDEIVAEGELHHSQQRVLHDSHHGLVGLRRHDLTRRQDDVENLGAGAVLKAKEQRKRKKGESSEK